MIDKQDEKLVQQMEQSLSMLDSEIYVKKPDISHFRRMVAEVHEKKRESQRRETIAFLICALTILGVEMFAFNRSFIAFIAVQAVALVALPVGVFLWLKHEHRQVNTK